MTWVRERKASRYGGTRVPFLPRVSDERALTSAFIKSSLREAGRTRERKTTHTQRVIITAPDDVCGRRF